MKSIISQLTINQNRLLKLLKQEWKEKIPHFCAIYCDRRKTFYKVKLYIIPEEYLKLAKEIAEKYKLGEIECKNTSHWQARISSKKYKDCVVRIPYKYL